MNKVIVMGPQDVAAMRKAHKEAAAAYYQAKVGALEFMAEEMRQTGEEYTASELSAMSGLTAGEIAQQLKGCRASIQAGVYDVRSRKVRIEEQYVRILPNGEIDPNQTVNIYRRKTVYSLPFRK